MSQGRSSTIEVMSRVLDTGEISRKPTTTPCKRWRPNGTHTTCPGITLPNSALGMEYVKASWESATLRREAAGTSTATSANGDGVAIGSATRSAFRSTLTRIVRFAWYSSRRRHSRGMPRARTRCFSAVMIESKVSTVDSS